MKDKVATVVITYNRIEFLKDLIVALRSQTRRPDKIIVVNNSSSDGTGEWLAGQSDLDVITQPNVGSSGGQYTGFKAALATGYDWIWAMDDDVLPAGNCLEKMLEKAETGSIYAPLRIAHEGNVYMNDTIGLNLSEPFKSIWTEILSEKHLDRELIRAEGITFEGPMMPREVVEKLGLPEKKFFIYADDTEYFARAKGAGIDCWLVRDAHLQRRLPGYFDPADFGWKHYYMIRNIIAVDVLHGGPAVRWLRPFGYLISWLKRCRRPDDIKTTLRAFFDGYFYKSES
ncbi:MAG: glycosyltransferase [Candidatus Kapaibacterium sp.]